MTTIKNNRPLLTKRLAAQGLKFLGAGVLSLAAIGCAGGIDLQAKRPTFEAQAEFGGVASAQTVAPTSTAPASYEAAPPAEASGSTGPYVQSGGATLESAEIVTVGANVSGRVAKGAPRFYAIDLKVGDSISVKTYARKLVEAGSTYCFIDLLEPDSVSLAKRSLPLFDGPDSLEREQFSATAEQAGRHIVKVKTNIRPVEYRIEITSLNRAGG